MLGLNQNVLENEEGAEVLLLQRKLHFSEVGPHVLVCKWKNIYFLIPPKRTQFAIASLPEFLRKNSLQSRLDCGGIDLFENRAPLENLLCLTWESLNNHQAITISAVIYGVNNAAFLRNDAMMQNLETIGRLAFCSECIYEAEPWPVPPHKPL
ncbi:MAG: hypothetical protein M1834_000742 [Cirrosporium novae-zelandiae]|nr:MAG: hypothetical protein M1834_000742 [Cirrosporium novae-zelandiae]